MKQWLIIAAVAFHAPAFALASDPPSRHLAMHVASVQFFAVGEDLTFRFDDIELK